MKKYKRNKSQQGQKNKLLIANFKQSEKLAKLKTPRNIIHIIIHRVDFHEGVQVLT